MFYAILVLVTLAACVTMLAPLWRNLDQDQGGEDIAVYKAQLKEVDKDLAKGVLNPDEAEAARIEVSRRLLAADKKAQEAAATRGAPQKGLAIGIGVVITLAVLAGYFQLGRPDLPDQPLLERLEAAQIARNNRPSQAEVEAQITQPEITIDDQYVTLLAQLREAVKSRPNDEEGLRLLAYHEANTAHFVNARIAQMQLIEVLGDQAQGSDYEDLAEYMVIATNGYVSPEAERALASALTADPSLPRARYYSGLMMAQTGRPDLALRLWDNLLEEGPEDAPWIDAIRAVYDDVARAAGRTNGPSRDDMIAAQELSDSERMEMIEGMVGGLSARLAEEGGSIQEWAQLIRALGVLGRRGEASDIWNEAQKVFADDPAALNLLRQAAQEAEVAQ